METTRASLLLRIRDRGDAGAWEQFDALYRPMLFRFALARGLDATDAEDVVQYAMIAIQDHICSFEYDPARGRFKGWLRTIVNNRIRNLLAARHEQHAESRDFRRPDPGAETPDELFDRAWMREHLEYCVRQLRQEVEPSSWQAFEAYALHEEPIELVCERLGMNANQVYTIKFRLTKKLSEMMTALLGDST